MRRSQTRVHWRSEAYLRPLLRSHTPYGLALSRLPTSITDEQPGSETVWLKGLLMHAPGTLTSSLLPDRRTLPNGMQVIVLPQHDAPLGTFWVWYRVGGRNERLGITGVSHWAEHMLFKGTQRIGPGEIFRRVTAAGGAINGFTWLDYTAYYETMPIDRLDVSLEIESDRMLNARFDPDEVASERTVIISERQGNENSPTFRLSEELGGIAFRAHPYANGVIGHMSDLERITREDLYTHYQQFYQPHNAVAVFVGDLGADEAHARIAEAFSFSGSGQPVPEMRSIEPEQGGERRVQVVRQAPNRVLSVVHRGVSAAHADAVPLMVLDAVLSGPSGMGFGGGAALGRSSRLYKALVASGLAAGASSSFPLTIDPYLFSSSVTLRPDSDAELVEQTLLAELERLTQEPVSEDELARIRKGMRAQHAYSLQGVTSRAYLLGSLAMVAPEIEPADLLQRMHEVTADDIQRVASTYLVQRSRTTAWLVPDASASLARAGSAPAAAAVNPVGVQPAFFSDGGLDTLMPGVIESALPNGLRVLTIDRPAASEGPISIRIRIPGGSSLDGGTPGAARFAADLLPRGSAGRTLESLSEELDGLGASISAGAGREAFDVSVTTLREDLPRVLELLAATVTQPDFPEDQLELVRAQALTGLRQSQQDTRAAAELVLREQLYPEGHPYRGRSGGDEHSIPTIQADDIRAWWHRVGRPDGSIVAVAGALSHDDAVTMLSEALAGWTGKASAVRVEEPLQVTQAGSATVEIPGKSQADVALGIAAIPRVHPDYHALSVANLIFGRLGLMGRVGQRVREQDGMAYYAFSQMEVGHGVGFWSVRAGVNPENIERAMAASVEELRRFLEGGPTEQEFADAIGNITGSLPMGLETTGSVANVLADIGFFELGHDYLQRYRGTVRSLTPEQLMDAMRRWIDPDRLVSTIARPSAE